jgi:hypothetical protein
MLDMLVIAIALLTRVIWLSQLVVIVFLIGVGVNVNNTELYRCGVGAEFKAVRKAAAASSIRVLVASSFPPMSRKS